MTIVRIKSIEKEKMARSSRNRRNSAQPKPRKSIVISAVSSMHVGMVGNIVVDYSDIFAFVFDAIFLIFLISSITTRNYSNIFRILNFVTEKYYVKTILYELLLFNILSLYFRRYHNYFMTTSFFVKSTRVFVTY